MGAKTSQITSLTIIYSTVYSDADQRKQQSSASLAFVRGIHRGPINSQHKWPVTRKMFSFDDVIMAKFLYVVHKTGTNVNVQGPHAHYGNITCGTLSSVHIISRLTEAMFTLKLSWDSNTIETPHDTQNDT